MPKRERGKQVRGRYYTQKDVAERAGVSPSIVSYVINNGPRSISEATRLRVLQAIEELDYHPNIHAQNLMRAPQENDLASQQFGVVISGPRSILVRPYYPKVLHGILEEAVLHNMSMRFLMFMDELDNPVIFNKLFHQEEISSVIYIAAKPVIKSEAELVLIERICARIPNFVSVYRSSPQVATVMYNLAEAIRQASAYLLSLGHRRVAYIGTTEKRIEGFRQAFTDCNLPVIPDLIYEIKDSNTSKHGYEQAQLLLNKGLFHGPDRVTAIAAASDEVAWGIIRCLKEAGLQIPQDVSITGIDNQVLSSYIVPSLTTVQLPMEAIGKMAVQTLVQRAGHTDEPPSTHVLPTRLIVRESCAPYQPEL